jgi:uncharacterized protein (DUF2141 family)
VSDNIWDDGYPSGGNYWSDYGGTDDKSGPNQDQPGSDGIGDTPYIIDENSEDNYPLINPWSSPVPDIAVTNVALSKTVVGQDQSVNINVTIVATAQSWPTPTIMVAVAIYANTTVIEAKLITLGPGESAIVAFTWNTGGFAKGRYTINATALSLSMANPAVLIDGDVQVTMFCDVNGDGSVDMADISLMIDWFMTSPPIWNSNCDVNDDLTIDMADISLAIDHFMESDP